MGATGIHVLLLRGINVGGRNRVPMADLRALLTGLGADDVVTHLQSGNVVCRASGSSAALAARTAEALAADLDVRVPVLGRPAARLVALTTGNPLAHLDDDPTRLHVTFLDGPPEPDRAAALAEEADAFAPERVVVDGAECFLHVPGPYHEARLGNAFLERRLGRTATTRNWRTVLALAELAG